MSYVQGQEVQEAKEAVESARAGLSQKRKENEKDQGRWSVATRRERGEKRKKEKKREKKKTKEGEKVAPRRQGSVCPQPKISTLVHKYLGSERPVSFEV